VELADLAGEQWFGGEGCPCIVPLIEDCRAAGFTPAFSPLLTHDYAAVQSFVATLGLVGLIPTLAFAAPRPDVVVRRLRPRPRPRMLRYAVTGPPTPLVERFRDHLRAALGRWPAPVAIRASE
jgi:hypothetical protein